MTTSGRSQTLILCERSFSCPSDVWSLRASLAPYADSSGSKTHVSTDLNERPLPGGNLPLRVSASGRRNTGRVVQHPIRGMRGPTVAAGIHAPRMCASFIWSARHTPAAVVIDSSRGSPFLTDQGFRMGSSPLPGDAFVRTKNSFTTALR